jgi:WD40 repeat protein
VKAIAVGTDDGKVVLLAADTGRELGRVTLSATAIRSIADTGDGLVIGDDAGSVSYLPLAGPDAPFSGGKQALYQGAGPVRAITAAGPARMLTGWSDGVVRLLDLHGHVLDQFSAHDAPVRAIAYDESTGWFAVTGDDGLVSTWDLAGNTPLVQPGLAVPDDLVGDTDAEGHVYVAGTTRRLLLVQPGGRSSVPVTNDFDGNVVDLDVSRDGRAAALGLNDRAVVVGLPSGTTLATASPGAGPALVALDGNRFVAARRQVVIVDLKNGSEQRLDVPDDVTLYALAVVPGTGTILAGGSSTTTGGALLEWSGADHRLLRRDRGQPGVAVTALSVDAPGNRVAVGRSDGLVEVLSVNGLVPNGVTFARHDREIADVIFTRSGHAIASLDAGNVVWIWNADFGATFAQPIHTGLELSRRLALDPSGTTLTVIGHPGTVDVRVDRAGIETLGCELAALQCRPYPGTDTSVLGG